MQCPICILHVKNSRELYSHLRSSHYGQTSPSHSDISTAKRRKHETHTKSLYKCAICTEEFLTVRTLYLHLRGHFKQQQDQLDIEEPSIKRRKLNLGQGGSGAVNKDQNVQKDPEGMQEPKPGPSGAQMRISHDGKLRMPNEEELQRDQTEKEKNSNDNNAPSVYSYQLIEISRRYNQRLGADNISYRLQVNENLMNRRISDIIGEMYTMFDNLVTNLRNELQNGDLVRLYLNHPILNVPIIISARPIEELTVEDIMTEVEKVLQSEEELKLDEQFEIHVGILRIPRGGRGKYFVDRQQSICRKRSIVEIVNTGDNLCFDRAVAVCLAKLKTLNSEDNKKKMKWKKIIHKKCTYQLEKAMKLRKSVGLPENHMVNVNDFKLYEDRHDVRIVVIDIEHEHTPFYLGSPNKTKQIYILKDSDHYHSILSVTGFYGTNHYCSTCLKAYNNHNHNCSTTCSTCKDNNCLMVQELLCADCNMTCRSEACHERHKKPKVCTKKSMTDEDNRKSLCEKIWKCLKCNSILNRLKRGPSEHVCGEYCCTNCHQFVSGLHLCYQRYSPPKTSNEKFIFYDFESRQDELEQCPDGYLRGEPCESHAHSQPSCRKCILCVHCKKSWCGKFKHIANFAVAQTVCSMCITTEISKSSRCVTCGSRCRKCKVIDRRGNYVKDPCIDTCGYQERIFRGDNTADQLAEWMFDGERSGFTAIAHNSGSYDAYFLLEYLLKNGKKPDTIIYQGSHITFMEIKKEYKLRLIDSLKFLPMKLSKFSKVFGLEETKGWFPHNFNRKENWNYIGPYPEKDSYGLTSMSEDEVQSFNHWYNEKVKSNSVFNFQDEIEHYCRLDVNILREGCLKYRNLMLDVTKAKYGDIEQPGIDPWQEITIASVCSQVYRSKFLEEAWRVRILQNEGTVEEEELWVDGKLKDGMLYVQLENDSWVPETQVNVVNKCFKDSPIAQIPPGGYTKNDNYSKISIVWLEWLMEQKKREGVKDFHITHALNGTEKRISHISSTGRRSYFRCDGFRANLRDSENNDNSVDSHDKMLGTVFDFFGCYYHGCKCIKGDRKHKPIHPQTRQTADQLYQATLDRQKYIEEQGYEYVSMWECQFRQQIKENPDLKNFQANLEIEERLQPRNGFMGGRTNAIKLYHKVQDNEKIKYYDVTSLYAYTNKYEQYMVGHCDVITDIPEDTKISDYFGMAHVRILPPRKLLHPVLPVKMEKKLVFPLCVLCAKHQNQTECSHTDKQRELVGTWCTPELQEAEKQGYIIKKIYEIYHWNKTTKYDPNSGKGGLFADYINTFLKIKQEASGWPSWCTDEDKKNDYIRSYMEKEKIQLDPEKIQHNPGLRALAKSKLTNFWGKYGQKENQLQTRFIDNIASLCELLMNESIQIHDFQVINDKVLLVQYKLRDEFSIGGTRSNIFIAAMTTCHARLTLYREIARLGDRVLYFDTDSIVFISRPGEYEPKLGEFLGEFTDELKCKDIGCEEKGCKKSHYITEFISAGPKNYSFKTDIGTTTCKVRGFTLNKTNKLIINFDSMKEMVTAPCGSSITRQVQKPRKITRNKSRCLIYNRS